MPALGRFWADASSIGPEPAQCWHIAVCLQGKVVTLTVLTRDSPGGDPATCACVSTNHLPNHCLAAWEASGLARFLAARFLAARFLAARFLAAGPGLQS